jgi:hypothetical protein
MAERGNLSVSMGAVGKGRGGMELSRDVVDPLRQANDIDWWQEQRLAARAFCKRRDAEIRELAQVRIISLPLQELIWEASLERTALEFEILEAVHQAELHLASELEYVLATSTTAKNLLTEYTGWTGRDLGQLAIGGTGTAAVATVAARASPGLLGMIGLGAASAVVAPLAVTVGAAVFAWSAASVVGGKRQAYLKLVEDAVTRLIMAQDSGDGSVLSRHLDRIDSVLSRRMEDVL